MSSAFRDGLRKLAESPPASKVVQTRFGEIAVRAPVAGRVDELRKSLGDKAAAVGFTQAMLAVLTCIDPATNEYVFTVDDIDWLNKVPASEFNAINEAAGELSESLTLDPTTTATGTGSVSVSGSESVSPDSATN